MASISTLATWMFDGLSWCRLLVESAWSSVLSRFELPIVHWYVWLLWLYGGLTKYSSWVFFGGSAPRAVLPEVYRKIGLRGIWRLFFSGPLYLAVTCSSCLPEEYRFAYFREMTSGMFPVFSALLGSTADTCSASV